MTHEEIKDTLYAFYDGELSGQSAREIETHLSSCAECRSVLDGWKRIAGAVFKKTETPDLVSRVMARLEPEEKLVAAPWQWRWMAPAFGLAFAALVYVLYPVKEIPEQFAQEQSYHLDDFLLENGEEMENEEDGIGTALEEYFL